MRDYNFFESYQKKRSVSVDVKSPVFLGMIVILLILALSAYMFAQNFIFAARLASASQQLAAIQASEEYQKVIKLQDSISAMKEFDNNASVALQRIQDGKVLGTDFLKKLSAVMPSTTNLQNISITRTGATLYVTVPTQEAAAELVGNLDKSGLFLQTTLASVSRDQDGGTFLATINTVLKAGEKK